MGRITKRRFYFAFFGEIISFLTALCSLFCAYSDTEHAIFYALLTLWMYSVHKDAETITNQYIKQEQENESTR